MAAVELTMAIFAAAYALGLNALMVRYNFLYYPLFPQDPKAEGGRGVHDCLRWVEEDLVVLNVELSQDTSRLHATVVELRGRLKRHVAQQVKAVGDGRQRVAKSTPPWARLAAILGVTLRQRPRLSPWYKLGTAMGFCYLDLLPKDDARILPHLRGLVRAATLLPEARVGTMPVVKLLRSCDLQASLADPCAVLRSVLQEEANELDTGAPEAAVIFKLQRLDCAIREVLDVVPDGSILELNMNPSNPFAMLRGQPYPITHHQGRILQLLVDAEGKGLTAADMRLKNDLLKSANIKREVDNLPPEIRVYIPRAKGWYGGYRWSE